MSRSRTYALAGVLGLAVIAADVRSDQAEQPPPQSPQQRAANLKAWLAASQAQLRAYEWIETTVISKDGEEKARKQNRVYYGVDGQQYKTLISETQAEAPRGPLRKRMAKKAKEDMTEYMQDAAQLLHKYVPPDPNGIQQAIDGGNFAVNMVDPGRRVRMDFHDYLKAGDTLGIEVELPTNRLLGIQVESYLEGPDDAVKMDADMGLLPDGTIYTATTRLDAAAKGVAVVVENTGHRRTGG